MCIIVAKEKGKKLPTKRIIETCFRNNSDGAGLMYVKDNQVIIDKGYMNFNDFYNRIKELKREFASDLTDRAIVFHFRIGTSGENDKQTTHPFPISKNEKDLRALKITTNVGMVHNGIISGYTYDSTLSDTQTFIRDYVSVFKELDKKFYKNDRVMQLLKETANSKLCFLDNKENIYYLGEFIKDNDIVYSNSTYKTDRYSYNWGWNNYYTPTTKETKNVSSFIEEKEYYEVLEVGDKYLIDGTLLEVKENDYLMIDQDFNLYEYNEDCVSLVGTDVIVYDKYYQPKWVYGY